jgi:3-oxoadipate enol-lactonase
MMLPADDPPALGLPPGRVVVLPRRGRTFVREFAGPPGAPTLLLLHGLAATAAVNWMATFGPLGRQYRVLAMDLRGHGRGIRSTLRPFRLEDCADDAMALADVLGIERVIPVGYSMGGPIAQLIWRRHHDRTAGLVLCATSRNFRGTPRADMGQMALAAGLTTTAAALRLVPDTLRRQVVRAGVNLRMATGGMDDEIREWIQRDLGRNDAVAVVEAWRSLGMFSSSPWITEVDVPTAVLITTADTVVPPHRQYKLAAAIPGAEIFEVEGGHTVCVADPERFVPALLDACQSVAARGSDTTANVSAF